MSLQSAAMRHGCNSPCVRICIALIVKFVLPWNLIASFFSSYDRSDELAEVFQANLFSRDGRAMTFGDLRPDRPRLLINATDLQSGRRFIFCDESFDELNSDLSK